MKRILCLLSLLFLASCAAPAPAPPADPAPAELPASTEEPPEETVLCRIIDGAEDGNLLLAGESVYRMDLPEDAPVTLVEAEGGSREADASCLEDGMTVQVIYTGLQETYPLGFDEVRSLTAYALGTAENPGGTEYDLCGLYLQALEDLWEEDPALNDGVKTLGMDLSQAPGGLTQAEKDALAWRFGELHGLEVVQGTWEELADQGYIDREHLYWEDGILFSLTPAEGHETEHYSLPTLFFDAQKWRSGLGAYFFEDCSAVWPEMGTWTGYTVGAVAIS